MARPFFLGLFVHLNVILKTDKFVFIYRDVYETKNFLEEEIAKLGISDYELVCLPAETLGQADTVYQGIVNINGDESLYIFNIDSRIIDFVKPKWADECDGYLEVFKGEAIMVICRQMVILIKFCGQLKKSVFQSFVVMDYTILRISLFLKVYF